jgi:signal transduction histidine kinase
MRSVFSGVLQKSGECRMVHRAFVPSAGPAVAAGGGLTRRGSEGRENDDLLAGSGEMAARMRSTGWSETALGSTDGWPQSLRSALSICLGSGFPIAIYWGPRLALLYNDAWSPILGTKHPWALGRDARQVWPEIWPTIGPLFEQVMGQGEATYSEDSLLPMFRHGYTEECYFNFTFTPIRGDGGRVEGVFNAVIETTFRVISERRTQLLRDLAERIAPARSAEEACSLAATCFADATRDVPFCALYLIDDGALVARLASSACLPAEGPATPARIDLSTSSGPWPLNQARASGRVEVLSNLAQHFGTTFPGGAWPEPAHSALVAPLLASGAVAGFLILGANPRRAIDDEYRLFVERAASLIATSVSNANAWEAERRRAAALAELDRAKTTFFSNVSHEFRTPLTLLIGPTEDALASKERALSGAALESVYRNELRLLRLVNALLEFSRIESGGALPSYEPTDLAALTRELVSSFDSAMKRAGLRLVVHAEPLPEAVYVDRRMWETIVLNLLSNAFKFTFEGEIGVTLRLAGDRIELQVRDTGTGIAAQELPRLFERFHRVEGARARTHEGSGIGLALVQELVRMHGGDIHSASELGKGTTFTITLPFGSKHLAPERIVPGSDTAARKPTGAQAYADEALRWLPEYPLAVPLPLPGGPADPDTHILVADDNADMRDYMTGLLSTRWRVSTAVDGHAALAALQTERFDLLLTDVMMPGLDGFGLLEAVKGAPSLRSTPVIMLSARAGEESRVEGLEAGADDYLVKPFSARELMARVETQLRLARSRADAESSRTRAEAATRAKDEFMAMLGHELRNPLSPILTALQLIRRRGKGGPEIDIIERQLNHLVRLVDDLMDISRITQGKIELRKVRAETSVIVLRGVELASPLLDKRRQRLDMQVPAEGLLLEGDADRLAQVVSNLLTNASKYSEPGSTIEMRATRAGSFVEVLVRDQGIGIPADMLGRIFDIFVQQPQASDRSRGGLGLGLAIVRSLIELHGGTVEARSGGLGQGSDFVVRLPLAARAEAPSASPAGRTPVTHGPRAAGVRVLVVDDNEDAADTAAELLTDLGHEVRVSNDAPGALEIARSFKPEVCLLDIGLPVLDGHDLARMIRQIEGMPDNLRLIAITGYGQDTDRRRSAEAGFDAHLVKPLDLDLLASLIRHA